MLKKQLKNPTTGNMFAWGYPSRQRLDSIRLGGGGLRLQADGDSRQLALTSQKYTLKSMILKDSPLGLHVRSAVKFKLENAHICTSSTVRKMLHNIIIKQ